MKKPNFSEPQYQKPPSLVPDDDLQFIMNQRKIKKSPNQSPEITRESFTENEDEEEPFQFGGTIGDEDSEDDDVEFRIPENNYNSDKGNDNNIFPNDDFGGEESSKEISLTENNSQHGSEKHPFFDNNFNVDVDDEASRQTTPKAKPSGGKMPDLVSGIKSIFNIGGGNNNPEETTDDTMSISSLGSTRAPRRPPPRRHKTPEEIAEEKQELLYRLDKLSKRYDLSKKFTMQSDLEDLKKEYNKLNKRKKLDQSLKSQAQYLMWGTTGVEYLNKMFNPLKFKLDGWSDLVKAEIDKGDYDEIFEELHEKYGEKIKMAPELNLIMTVAGSGFMYHMSHQMSQQMPGLADVFNKRPDIQEEIMKTQMDEARKQNGGGNPMQNMMFGAAEKKMGGGMRGPSMADDILNRFKSQGADATQTETTNDTQQFRFT